MSNDNKTDMLIFPSPSEDLLRSCCYWRDHSAFVFETGRNSIFNDLYDVVYVPDGASPQETLRKSFCTPEISRIAAVECASPVADLYPIDTAIACAKACLALGLIKDYDAIYCFDGSIDACCSEEVGDGQIDLAFKVTSQNNAMNPADNLGLSMSSRGHVRWHGEIPEDIRRYRDAQRKRQNALMIENRLVSALQIDNDIFDDPNRDVVKNANLLMAAFETMTFGQIATYSERCEQYNQAFFDVTPQKQWAMNNVMFNRLSEEEPVNWQMADEISRTCNDVYAIWRHFIPGISFNEVDLETLEQQGRNAGIDYAIDSYVSGVELRYILN